MLRPSAVEGQRGLSVRVDGAAVVGFGAAGRPAIMGNDTDDSNAAGSRPPFLCRGCQQRRALKPGHLCRACSDWLNPPAVRAARDALAKPQPSGPLMNGRGPHDA